jgi:hypothetical protein
MREFIHMCEIVLCHKFDVDTQSIPLADTDFISEPSLLAFTELCSFPMLDAIKSGLWERCL